jgi:hypothetical protein
MQSSETSDLMKKFIASNDNIYPIYRITKKSASGLEIYLSAGHTDELKTSNFVTLYAICPSEKIV